jgi:predicted phosphodiesterase
VGINSIGESMKLRIWSDIHSEFGQLKVTPREDDKETVLVIAGDFLVWTNPDDSVEQLRELAQQFKAIVYVAGNHEFYGSTHQDVIVGLRTVADSIDNLYFLDGDYCIIDDVRFIGGTLWTDMDGSASYTMARIEQGMNDYRQIKYRDRDGVVNTLRAADVVKLNAWYRGQFRTWLDVGWEGKTVVVSHHLPDYYYARAYADYDLVYAYGNTLMQDLVAKADIWIHGHAHIRQEYEIEGVHVIANPRGYVGYQTMAYTFQDDKIWEV